MSTSAPASAPAPAGGSRYDRFRRRLGPVALVIAIGVLVQQTCASKHDEAARTVVELRFGRHLGEVRHLRADVLVDDVPVAHLDRDLGAGPAGPVSIPAALDGARPRILIDLSTTRGPRRIERALTAPIDGTVVVDLVGELDRASPSPP